MKKILIMLLLLTVVFALSACGGAEIRTLSDLERDGIIIAVQNATTGHIYAQENFPNAQIDAFPLFSDAIMALLVGAADAVIIDYIPGWNFINENPDRLTFVGDVLTEEGYGIAFQHGSRLTEMFNGALNQLREDGTFQAIYDYWINNLPGASRYVSPPGTEHPNGVLHMATSAGFPPFELFEGENIVGFDPCLANAIGDILGYRIEIHHMEFGVIIPSVQAGQFDFGMAGMTVRDDRREYVDFSQIYFMSGQRVVARIPGAELLEGEAPALYGEENGGEENGEETTDETNGEEADED